MTESFGAIDLPIALALLSLMVVTVISNILAHRRERAVEFDPVTHEARELLIRERAEPIPLCPTLTPEHWARLAAVQPGWRRQVFEAARARYDETRAVFVRNEFNGELYYPDPAAVSVAVHELLVLTQRF